jgi:hypothetical protein
MSTVIQAIRDHIKTCPFLTFDERAGFDVDYFAGDSTAYMIKATPIQSIVKRYINGDSDRQVTFAFSTREAYGKDAEQNQSSTNVLEQFGEWLESCNLSGDLPILDEGRKALSYETLSTAYSFQATPDTARYLIQCQLIYLQKRS